MTAVIGLPRRRRLIAVVPLLLALVFALTGNEHQAPARPRRAKPAFLRGSPNPDLAEALTLPIVDGHPILMERVDGPHASLRAAIRAPYTVEAEDGDVQVVRRWPTYANGEDLLLVFRTEAGWWVRALGFERERSPVALHALHARDELGPFDVDVTFEQWRVGRAVNVLRTLCRTIGTPSCATITVSYTRYERPHASPCPEPGTTELCPHSTQATVDGDSVVVAGRNHRDRVIHERRRIIWRP